MAHPIKVVKDINESKDLWKIVVRCKHLWTVTSASKKEHIEMILVDSELDTIQVIVPPFLVSKFKEQLALGCSYVMQNFKVSNNDFSFKSTNHSFKLVLCGSTSIKKAELPDIPMNYLNILHLDAIVEGEFQSNILVDILGGVTEISQTQINVDNKKSKVVFSITDDSNISKVQCTLWGQLAIQFHDYYKSHKEDGSIIVLLINARIKEAQGGFPLNISNAWNGTKLLINDVTLAVVIKLRDSLQSEFPLLSSSSLQDGKLVCYSKHIIPTPVPRYKLEVLAVDGKYKARFIFWDGDCVKLIGKSALQMKNELIEADEDDPLEFPYALDAILKQELAIRAVFQPNKGKISVISFKIEEDFRKRVRGSFSSEEPTSKLIPTEPSSQDESISFTEPLSADIESVQISAAKLIKDIKKEK
ncbi:unnamed protein product [Vicia faba]|uniref:Replication protein A 70 kDa DNA-binding subunit B/D first OB fold domain-containing protein n=1 Tax=Vicia faba TaxID=3906 RepID=A0AAV0ZFZ1_VICFA|nr:unnamed protein product [Vicia faba]